MTTSSVSAFSPNPDFDYEIRTVLGAASAGAADIGEVLAAVHGVHKNDHEGWYTAWNALGERVTGEGDAAATAGHAASAASAYLRGSHYYAVAVNAASALDSGDELLAVFRRHRAAWDRFVDITDHQVERVEIPYEGTTLPGYLFRPTADGTDLAHPDGPRHPLLVAVNGSDGSLTSLWASCVSGALRRGYAALVFDGPGQQSMLFERGTTFRPDWEAVLTPVYDFAAARADIDPARIALYGISQGGYWAPRALTVEHRYAAAVLDPGVVDVSASWLAHFPKSLVAEFERSEFAKFDKNMALGMRFSPGGTKTWAFRARPYGPGGYADTLRAVRAYTIDDDAAARITTPMLITDPEGEQFWPGQSARLVGLAPTVSTIVPFTAAEGADLHCEPLARALVEQRMFDWLDERLASAS